MQARILEMPDRLSGGTCRYAAPVVVIQTTILPFAPSRLPVAFSPPPRAIASALIGPLVLTLVI